MSQEKTEAIVLRGIDFSETSRIITFLSPDRGRLTCMAKGVRRRNSSLAPMLDTFNRLEIVYYWKDARSIQQLAEATILDTFSPIKRDLERATRAAVSLEMAGKAAHENEPSFALYATLVHGLESLSQWTGNLRLHACWQAVHILAAAGHAPNLTTCIECGADIPDPINWSRPPGFSYHGGIACANCRADVRLTSELYATLHALLEHPDACPDMDMQGGLDKITYTFAMHQLETDLRSVRVMNEMFGQTN